MGSLTDKISDWTVPEFVAAVRQIQNTNYDLPGGLSLSDLTVKNLSVEGDFAFQLAIGSHIGELGEGNRGKIGLLRVGTDYAHVLWDSFSGKWITPPLLLLTLPTAVRASGNLASDEVLFPVKTYINGGMTPQFRFMARATNSGGGNQTLGLATTSANIGNNIVSYTDLVSVAADGTIAIRDSGWITDTSLTLDIGLAITYVNSAGGVNVLGGAVYLRWIST